MKIINYKHSGHLGDIIYSIPFILTTLKSPSTDKVHLFIPKGKPYQAPVGQNHICGNVWMSSRMYEFIYPLLKEQYYFNEISFTDEEAIPKDAVNLDLFREQHIINLASGSIKDYYFKTFGVIKTNHTPWIELPKDATPSMSFDIVVGRSTRYVNTSIDYSVLTRIKDLNIGFVGTKIEFHELINEFPTIAIKHLDCKNALDAAAYIKSCRLFIGNQSLFFSIAESLQVNRILEVCELCPNVIPEGGLSGQFLTNLSLINLLNFFLKVNINPLEFPSLAPKYIYGKDISELNV